MQICIRRVEPRSECSPLPRSLAGDAARERLHSAPLHALSYARGYPPTRYGQIGTAAGRRVAAGVSPRCAKAPPPPFIAHPSACGLRSRCRSPTPTPPRLPPRPLCGMAALRSPLWSPACRWLVSLSVRLVLGALRPVGLGGGQMPRHSLSSLSARARSPPRPSAAAAGLLRGSPLSRRPRSPPRRSRGGCGFGALPLRAALSGGGGERRHSRRGTYSPPAGAVICRCPLFLLLLPVSVPLPRSPSRPLPPQGGWGKRGACGSPLRRGRELFRRAALRRFRRVPHQTAQKNSAVALPTALKIYPVVPPRLSLGASRGFRRPQTTPRPSPTVTICPTSTVMTPPTAAICPLRRS